MPKLNEFQSDSHITRAHCEAIGLVASEWTLLENELRWQMAAALGLAKKTWIAILTRGAGGRELAEIYKGLLEWGALVEWQRDALDPVLNRIIQLVEERNRYVHAMWVLDVEDVSKVEFPTSPGPKRRASALTMTKRGRAFPSITATSKEIRVTAHRIGEARKDLWRRIDAARPIDAP